MRFIEVPRNRSLRELMGSGLALYSSLLCAFEPPTQRHLMDTQVRRNLARAIPLLPIDHHDQASLMPAALEQLLVLGSKKWMPSTYGSVVWS